MTLTGGLHYNLLAKSCHTHHQIRRCFKVGKGQLVTVDTTHPADYRAHVVPVQPAAQAKAFVHESPQRLRAMQRLKPGRHARSVLREDDMTYRCRPLSDRIPGWRQVAQYL